MSGNRPITIEQINAAIAQWTAETGSVDTALSIARVRIGKRAVAQWIHRRDEPFVAERNRNADYRQSLINEGLHPDLVADAVHPDYLPSPRPDSGAAPIRKRGFRGVFVIGSSDDNDSFEPDVRP
jgi:hypothetical protein